MNEFIFKCSDLGLYILELRLLLGINSTLRDDKTGLKNVPTVYACLNPSFYMLHCVLPHNMYVRETAVPNLFK